MPEIPHPSQDALRFAEQIDSWARKELSIDDALMFRKHTPEVLIKENLPDLPMLYTQKHLKQALASRSSNHIKNHGLTKDILSQVVDLVETPAIIMKNIRLDKWDRPKTHYVLTVPLVDTAKNPIVVAIMVKGRGLTKGETYPQTLC